MNLERRYDLKNYEPPENCRGCRFRPVVAQSVVDMNCPVHGSSTTPNVGPPDWPAIVMVRVED